MIIRWPGRVSAGTVIDDPAMSMDLFPTLLEMAGLPTRPEQHVDGTSLTGALTADAGVRSALHWHFPHYHGSGNRPGGAVRVGDLKLVEWFEDGTVELYDLSDDISERRDLSLERPADTERLLTALRSWRQEVGASMPTER
jgi:arylsulfatase A-like enzyme